MSLLGWVEGLVREIVSTTVVTTVVTCAVPWLSEFVLQRIPPLWQRYWPVIYQSVLVPAYHLVSDTIQPLLHDLLSNYGDSSAVSASESPPGGTSPHDQNIQGRASDPVLNPTTSMPSDIEDITRISTSESPTRSQGGTPAEAPKKKVKKTIIPVVEHIHGGMCPADVQKATEKEFEMALQDRVMEETKDKKNAVEAYVYDMRNKLHGKYQEFVTDPEREGLTAKLQEVEDWLYEDGEDETKGVYIAKLEELKKQGDPIEERYKEYTERGPVIDQLVYCINSYRDAVMSNDPKFNHIDLAEKQKVLNECVEAKAWLREKKQHQDSLPKYATPALLSADVRRKAEALDRFARPIMTKPKPAGDRRK